MLSDLSPFGLITYQRVGGDARVGQDLLDGDAEADAVEAVPRDPRGERLERLVGVCELM